MVSFGGFLKGFERGVKMAGDIERNRYGAQLTRARKAETENTWPSEDPNFDPNRSPLNGSGGGTKIASADTKIDTTKTSSTGKGDDISGTGGSDTQVGSAGQDDLKGGGSFVDNVYNYYRSKGLSHAAAAGWAGNFMQESGGAADVLQGKRKGDAGASGYAGQWQGKRQRNLLAFAKDRGHSSPSLSDQLDFALEEGKADSPYRDDVWVNHAAKLDAAQSPQEATAIIRKFFERPSADDLNKRTRYAMMAGKGGGGFTDMAGGAVASASNSGGDDLTNGSRPAGRPVASGVLPEPEESSSDTGGGGTEIASAGMKIDPTNVNFAAPQQDFNLAGMDTDWARPVRQDDTLMAAEGGAIPDFTSGVLGSSTDGSGTDTSNKNSSFGWGSILGNSGLPQGGKATDAGLGGSGDFGKGGGFANANYGSTGAGAQPQEGWFNRDTADAQAAQAGRLARQRVSAQQAAGAANVLKNQNQAAIDEKTRQDALAAAQAKATADAAAKAKATADAAAAAKAKATADAAAKAKATAAAAAAAKAKAGAKTATPLTTAPATGVNLKPGLVTGNAGVTGGVTGTGVTDAYSAGGPKYVLTNATMPVESNNMDWARYNAQQKFREVYADAQKWGIPLTPQQIQAGINAGMLREMAPTSANPKPVNDPLSSYHYAEGGAIPDLDSGSGGGNMVAGFAKGGDTGGLFSGYFTKRAPRKTLPNRDEMFQKFLKEEERHSLGRGGGGNESARDRAARRLNKLEGGPNSSAYRPGGGGKTAPAGGQRAPTPTPRPDPVTTGSTPEIADPHTNVTREPGIGSGIPTPAPVDRIGSGIPTPAPREPGIGSGIPTPATNPNRSKDDLLVSPTTRSPTSEPNSPPMGEISDPHINVGAIPDPTKPDEVDPTSWPYIPDSIRGTPTGTPPAGPPPESGNAPEPPLYRHQATEAAQRDRAVHAIRSQQELRRKFPKQKFDPNLPPDPVAAAPAPAPAPAITPAVTPAPAPAPARPSPTPPAAAQPAQPGTTAPAPAITPAVSPDVSLTPDAPVLPDTIDTRPAPTAAAPPAENPDHAKFIQAAKLQLISGRDPHEVASTLESLGVPKEQWPASLKIITPDDDEEGTPAFAKGGAIPDPEESHGGGSFFSGLNVQAAGEGRSEPLQATPKLRNDAAVAAHDGLQFLKREFGLGGEGAVPTPDDPAIRAQGARRMASGEGAASEEEVQNLNRQFDPQGQLTGNDAEIHRLAAVHAWFLEHGQPEKAGAVAASLMQYQAQRTQHIGAVAAGAYAKYQQTGDPKDLDATAQALEMAYDMIPNGSKAQIELSEDGKSLQVDHTDADGNHYSQEIGPNEIPKYLQLATTGEGYWGEIAKLADPKGYQSKLDEGRQVREGQRDEQRTVRKEGRDASNWTHQREVMTQEQKDQEERTNKAADKRWKEQHDVTRGETLSDADTARKQAVEDAASKAEADVKNKLLDAKLKIIEAQAKPGEDKMDAAAYDEAYRNAAKARVAYDADPSEENKNTLDVFVGEMYRKNGHDAQKITDLGFDLGATTAAADAAPFPGWVKKYSQKYGAETWMSPDGKQMVDPTGAS